VQQQVALQSHWGLLQPQQQRRHQCWEQPAHQRQQQVSPGRPLLQGQLVCLQQARLLLGLWQLLGLLPRVLLHLVLGLHQLLVSGFDFARSLRAVRKRHMGALLHTSPAGGQPTLRY
jgi:hypothetical protein